MTDSIQGVPTSLKYPQKCLRAKFTKKNVFRSKKLLFQPFFLNCKIENGFLKQLFSILLNKSLHKIMEKSCLQKPFSILQFRKKGSKSNFLERNTFFRKRCSLRSQTFLSLFQTCCDTLYYQKMLHFLFGQKNSI